MIIVITGPTSTGKTRLSIALAKYFNGEIINADGMQVYKGLDIGTAKVTESEKDGIIHHLFDIKEVNEEYNIFEYQKDSREKIDEIKMKNKVPILVGGSGLYLKSALYNYQLSEHSTTNLYEDLSNDELYQLVLEKDKNSSIHPHNRKRMVRFLNNDNSKPQTKDELLYDNVIFIGLKLDREKLYSLADKRVDSMIKNGLIAEVNRYYLAGDRSLPLISGIGYKELYDYFDKKISLEEAVDLIKKNTRHYIKRQYTWFNNQMQLNWFDVNLDDFDRTIEEVINYINLTTNKK